MHTQTVIRKKKKNNKHNIVLAAKRPGSAYRADSNIKLQITVKNNHSKIFQLLVVLTSHALYQSILDIFSNNYYMQRWAAQVIKVAPQAHAQIL